MFSDYSHESETLGTDNVETLIADALANNNDPPPSWTDQCAALVDLAILERSGALSSAIIDSWRSHVSANRARSCFLPAQNFVEVRWPRPSSNLIEPFLRSNPIEVVDGLGREVKAALFTGPYCNKFVLSRAILKDPTETAFLIYHMLMHLLGGHMRNRTYGFRIEYTRGKAVPLLQDLPAYHDEENWADDTATCLWDGAYSSSALTWAYAKLLAKAGQDCVGVDPPLIRAMLRDRSWFRQSIFNRLPFSSRVLRSLRNLLYPPVSYTGPAAVVHGSSRSVYFVCKDPRDPKLIWKRWVPSQRVLARLGIAAEDVVPVEDAELEHYRPGRLLIEPIEVDHARQLLERSLQLVHRPAKLVRPETRLAVFKKITGAQMSADPAWAEFWCSSVYRGTDTVAPFTLKKG